MKVAFLWQAQIQTTEYGLYDVVRIKKERIYIDSLIIYTQWHEFWTNFGAQCDFCKIFVSKMLLRRVGTFFYLRKVCFRPMNLCRIML